MKTEIINLMYQAAQMTKKTTNDMAESIVLITTADIPEYPPIAFSREVAQAYLTEKAKSLYLLSALQEVADDWRQAKLHVPIYVTDAINKALADS